MTTLDRTKDNPWLRKTPPGTAEYTMHGDDRNGEQVLVCTVGKTALRYDARCIDDLHAMLKSAADWVELGGADEQKPAKNGTVEASIGKQSASVLRYTWIIGVSDDRCPGLSTYRQPGSLDNVRSR